MQYDVMSDAFAGAEGADETRGWPTIEVVRQKKVLTPLPHTKKMSIFVSSSISRRQPESVAYRADRRRQRADG